jgi:DNA-directed RNA polymerase specialized sigma24 family protein
MNLTFPDQLRQSPHSFAVNPSSNEDRELILELADKIESLPPDERRWVLKRLDGGTSYRRNARCWG